MGTPSTWPRSRPRASRANTGRTSTPWGPCSTRCSWGDPPHAGETSSRYSTARPASPSCRPGASAGGLSPELEQLILWTLEDDPNARPQTMAQLGYELTKLIHGRAGAVASLLGIPAPGAPAARPAAHVAHREGRPVYDPETPSRSSQGRAARALWVLGAVGAGGAGGLGSALFSPAGQRRRLTGPSSPGGRRGRRAWTRRRIRRVGASPPPTPVAAADSSTHQEAGPAPPGGQEEGGPLPVADLPPRRGRQHLMAGRFAAARLAFEGASRSEQAPGRPSWAWPRWPSSWASTTRPWSHARLAVKKGVGYRGQAGAGQRPLQAARLQDGGQDLPGSAGPAQPQRGQTEPGRGQQADANQ